MRKLTFDLVTKEGTKNMEFDIDNVLLIGLAERDVEKTKKRLRKMKSEGIICPDNVPVIYFVSDNTLTQEDYITVTGRDTSGEVEFTILKRGEKIYIGLGSDQTDRDLGITKIIKSKQVCDKPISKVIWDYDEIKDHWDSIEISSWMVNDGEEILDQKGTLAELMTVEDLIAESLLLVETVEDCIIYSGTVPWINPTKHADAYKCLIEDKVLGRKIEFTYKVRVNEDWI